MNKEIIFYLVLFVIAMGAIFFIDFYYFIGVLILIPLHELGHAIVAKCYGKFKGFTISKGTFGVRTSGSNNMIHISGFLFHSLTFPVLYVLGAPFSIIFFVFLGGLAGSSSDLVRIVKDLRRKKND